jgi:hypothetical protein
MVRYDETIVVVCIGLAAMSLTLKSSEPWDEVESSQPDWNGWEPRVRYLIESGAALEG